MVFVVLRGVTSIGLLIWLDRHYSGVDGVLSMNFRTNSLDRVKQKIKQRHFGTPGDEARCVVWEEIERDAGVRGVTAVIDNRPFLE